MLMYHIYKQNLMYKWLLILLFSGHFNIAMSQEKPAISNIIKQNFQPDAAYSYLDSIFNTKISSQTRLVGIGEVCHGSEEVKLFENRMTEYLISRKGYNLLLIEMPDNDLQAINYFLNNDSLKDIRMLDSIAAENFKFTYANNAYTINLLKWLKGFNLLHSNGAKIKVKGVDLVRLSDIHYFMTAFFYKYIFPSDIKKAKEFLYKAGNSTDSMRLMDQYSWFEINKNKLRETYNNAEIDSLERNFKDYLDRMYYNNLLSMEKWHPSTDSFGRTYSRFRDSTMANKIQELMQNNKAIIIGHNAHIYSGDNIACGYFLEKNLGQQYYRIVTDFATESSFTVYDSTTNTDSIASIRQYAPSKYSAGWILNDADENCEGVYFYSDLFRPLRGAIYISLIDAMGKFALARNGFDALVLFKKMHPVRINK